MHQKTYPQTPYALNAQLRVFNTENCAYTFTTNQNPQTFVVEPYSVYTNKWLTVHGSEELTYSIQAESTNCKQYEGGQQTINEHEAWSLFLNNRNDSATTYWTTDFVSKPSDSYPLVRNVANTQQQRLIVWRNSKNEYSLHANETKLQSMSSGDYDVFIDNDQKVGTYNVHTGGVYTLLVNELDDGTYHGELIEITEPNSMNILWLIPQYVVMTLGEVMFSVTGLEFSYAQAPPSMKSVLQACWLLTVAFGNVIVVIIAEAALFDSQASEFFLFAGLMFIDMLIFMFMAYRYVPNNPNKSDSEVEPLTNEEENSNGNLNRKIAPIEGIENKGKDINE